jgi:hypothetical protein
MAQRQAPRGTTGGTGNGGAGGKYIQRNPVREVTCDQTTEAEMRQRAQSQGNHNQPSTIPQPCNSQTKSR